MPVRQATAKELYGSMVATEATALGIPVPLATQLIDQESRWDPKAVSPKGARGLMQLMPETAKSLGVDPDDPVQNIRGGLRYFRQQLDTFGGDVRLALAAYNAGPGALRRRIVAPTERPTGWGDIEEQQFKDWYTGIAQRNRLAPDPDDPLHKYNYRYAFRAGAQPDASGHWPSDYKAADHPTRYVDGRDVAGMWEIPNFPETQTYVQAVSQGQPAVIPPQRGRIRPATAAEMPSGPPPAPTSQIGPGPSGATRFSRFATPLVGALAGGLKGAAVGSAGGPVGTFVGGVAGAGIGAGAGELLQSGWEYLTSDAPPTPSGIARRVGSAAQTGAVAEASGIGGMGVAKAATSRLAAPFASKLEPYAAEAMATFRRPGQTPAVLPSEVTTSRVLDVASNVTEGSILGGAKLAGVRDARQAIAEEKVLGVLDQLGPRSSPMGAGTGVVNARKAAIQSFRGQEKQAWEAFQQETNQVPMAATPRLDAFIQELQPQQAGAILPNAGMTAARRVADLMKKGEVETLMIGGRETAIENLSPQQLQAYVNAGVDLAGPPEPALTVGQFHKTVSDLGRLSRVLERAARTDPSKNADAGLAKKLYGLAQDDLEEAVKVIGPKAETAYEQARLVSRLGNEQLFNESIRNVVKGAPEKIVGKLLQRNNSTAIDAVRQASGPAAFEEVQSAAMQRILQANSRSSRINWDQVVTRLDNLGDDTLKAMFPGDHAAEVRRVATLMQNLKRTPAGGIGKVGIQLTQWGAAAGLATGNLPPEAAVVLLTPPMLAKIFTSKIGLKYLTTGLTAPVGSQRAITAGTQLLAFLGRDVDQIQGPPPAPSQTSGPPAPQGR